MARTIGAGVCLVVLGLSSACGREPRPEVEAAGPAAGHAVFTDVDGNAQKGPFSSGTRVSIAELDAQLVQTGRSFATTLSDDRGSFSVRGVQLGTPYARVEVSGFYFDEVRGRLSDSPLSIFSYLDLSDPSARNVNLLGHLEAARLEYLVGEEQVRFADAKARAHTEVLQLFELEPAAVGSADALDISKPGAGNAALLAVSVILQGHRPVSELSQLLANIQNDLRADGSLDVAANGTALLEGAMGVNMEQVVANLQQRFQAAGAEASVPDASEALDRFLGAGKYVPPEGGGGATGGADGSGAGGSGESPGGTGGSGGDMPGDPLPPEPMGDCTIETCPCETIWRGDFNFTGPEALEALGCVSEITGALRLHQTCGIETLTLPALTRVGGDLYFHQTGFESVSLPALTSVEGVVYFHQNSALTSVSLPTLSSVGENVYFNGNCSLGSVSLDALVRVGPQSPTEPVNTPSSIQSYLYVAANAQLPQLSLPGLSRVAGYVYVAQNCSLQALGMLNLSSIGGYVYVKDNVALGAGAITTLDAHLTEIDFGGERTLSAGGECLPLEDLCGEPSCGVAP